MNYVYNNLNCPCNGCRQQPCHLSRIICVILIWILLGRPICFITSLSSATFRQFSPHFWTVVCFLVKHKPHLAPRVVLTPKFSLLAGLTAEIFPLICISISPFSCEFHGHSCKGLYCVVCWPFPFVFTDSLSDGSAFSSHISWERSFLQEVLT